MQVTNTYVGRFAPSPTGPLHFGSLIAALASYLDARHHLGTWLLRIEDLDPPRESKTAPQEILEQLRHFKFQWDGEPIFQSQHLERYDSCLKQLVTQDDVYQCICSRKSFDQVYPGRCRSQRHNQQPAATRLVVGKQQVAFTDLIQGNQNFDLETDIGDFIVKRKDGLFAYQLAVVVDDHDQGVTHVIRGCDLLDSTPRQICLASKLGFQSPQFGHFPVVTDTLGHKLSKQTKARAIRSSESSTDNLNSASDTIKQALKTLGQPIPDNNDLEQIMSFAIKSWNRGSIPKQVQLLSPVL